jgi:tripartite-type tricarboxylate transporter receptor subunit TctC
MIATAVLICPAAARRPILPARTVEAGMMTTDRRGALMGLGAAALTGSAPMGRRAQAETWPTRPVRILVGFAAGGGTDIITRLVAQGMATATGGTFVVENRPGAGTTLASEAVARAAPDGATMLAVSSSYSTAASLYRALRFDPVRDFAPVVQITTGPFCLVVHPSFPARTVQELLSLARSRPGGLAYASSGVGGHGHLAGELMRRMTGAPLEHVPYRGSAPAIADVVAGTVPLLFSDLTSVLAAIRGGDLRIVAVTSLARWATLPDIPAVAEEGLPGYEVTGWSGLLFPAGTAPAVVAAANAAANQALLMPEIRGRLNELGGNVVGGPPEAFGRFVEREIAKWREVIRAAGIAPQD